MTKHYVLSLDSSAEYDWDRCVLRDPLTAKRPDLAQLVAEAIGKQSGSYLVSVNIEVSVLEAVSSQPQPTIAEAPRPSHRPEELAA